MTRLTLTIVLLSMSLARAAINAPVQVFANLPITFERNQGQWPHDIEYGAHVGGHQYTFVGREIVIDRAIHLELISSRIGKLEALDPVETKTNYLTGVDSRKWITGVPNYSRIRQRNAFPGIDLILFGSHGQLEFDYVVAPGANPDQIRLKVRGASFQLVSGDIKLTTPSGEALDLRAPRAYQATGTSRRVIDCRFQVHGREILFTSAPYDRALPLLIDPVLAYLDTIPGTYLSISAAPRSSRMPAAISISQETRCQRYSRLHLALCAPRRPARSFIASIRG
jgi:hypothetical protein